MPFPLPAPVVAPPEGCTQRQKREGYQTIWRPQKTSRSMRGRLHPLAVLFVLALLPSGRAVSLPGGGGGLNDDDPCVDLGAAFEDPTAIVVIAGHCTVHVKVSVTRADNGNVVITVAIAYAEHGRTFVVECSDPDRLLPKLGQGGMHRDAMCWKHDEGLA